MVADSTNGAAGSGKTLKKNPAQIFTEGTEVDAGVRESLRQVRILHKKMGVPLVGSVDGKLVSIPPEQIEIDIQHDAIK